MKSFRRFATAFTLIALVSFLTGCCCGRSRRGTAAKDVAMQQRRPSEFDFYCAMRPPAQPTTGKGQVAFTTVVFDAMRAQGYKVYLVHYESRGATARIKPAGYGFRDFFGGVPMQEMQLPPVAYQSGYGMRDFFGDRMATDSQAPGFGSVPATHNAANGRRHSGAHSRAGTRLDDGAETPDWNREVVLWENRRGEFFLVTGPYAQPVWVEGGSWLQKVRFCDPAAVAVAQVRS